MNYYGTDAHMKRMRGLEDRVFAKIDCSKPGREKELGNGYSVRYYDFADEEQEDGEICRLFHNGERIFEWKNTDGHSRLADLIHHSNGKDYFIFDEDLYGYSVLDLGSMEVMHYIPAESYREPVEEMEETFLWCACFYDPATDLLAVEGCYWACPYGVIVLDFSDPMTPVEAEKWTDLSDLCDLKPEDRSEISPVRWEDTKLICKAGDREFGLALRRREDR